MVKVVLQYLIPWCILSALLLLLLHLRMLSEVPETKGMTSSTGLYMEDIESRSSDKNKKFNRSPALQANDNQCSGKNNKESLSKRELKLRGTDLCTTSINDNQQRWTKTTSTKTTVHPTKQLITLDLCLVFVYHIATKKKSVETTFFITTILLWKLSYAFPIHDSSSTKEKQNTEIPKITPSENKERQARSATPNNQNFSQGDCQSEWSQNEQKCYRYFPEKMNYDSASEHCSSFQSQLVALKTEEENTFVIQLSNAFRSDGYLWTGVRNSCGNCTDTARRYENWCPGQPDYRSRCVVMVETGKWKDFDCGYMFAFVCEKGNSKAAYSREQLLIALLIPIFSCLSFAVAFTASLLVSSIRRGSQPFKVASRYARVGNARKIATWDMIETIRRASLRRKETKHNRAQRGSIPNIEVTSPDQVRESGVDGRQGVNSEQPNGRTETKEQRGRRKTLKGETSKEKSSTAKSSKEKSSKGKSSKGKSSKGKSSKGKTSFFERPFLQAPTDRRRSSGSGSNSSLYELLVWLNKIEFDQGKDNQNSEEHELKRKDTAEGEASGGGDLDKLVAKTEQNVGDNCGQKQSFRNMAFRDSQPSVETNGGGVNTITSLNPSGNIPAILVKDSSEEDSPGKDTSGKVTPGNDTSENVTSEKNTPGNNNPEKHNQSDHRKYPTDSESDAHVSGKMKNSKVVRGDWMEMSKITKIVRVDVHRTSTPEDSPAIGDVVSVVTTTSDSGNYTPGENVTEVSQDGESKCVELQSRVPDTRGMEPSENKETVKVDVRRISNDNDFPSCNGSIVIVKTDSEQTKYEWEILRTYSV